MVSADAVHWTDWDFALADAINFIKDHTNKHGHLVFEQEDRERVEVIVEKKIDRVDAIIERRTRGSKNKPYEPTPGEHYASRLKLMPGEDKWPTAEEWYAEQDALLQAEVDEDE